MSFKLTSVLDLQGSEDQRIPERFGLEGILKSISFHPSAQAAPGPILGLRHFQAWGSAQVYKFTIFFSRSGVNVPALP